MQHRRRSQHGSRHGQCARQPHRQRRLRAGHERLDFAYTQSSGSFIATGKLTRLAFFLATDVNSGAFYIDKVSLEQTATRVHCDFTPASAQRMACYAPHAAFAHPATPPGTPPRESIEIRCLLIYD
ncbi:hypothetical protein [Massilia aerilata]|uniref:Uncharacterized protein n=1 Tax=Massilia aerilata TaxID=453817 RepID=A0ABW0RYL4_9BURK